MSQQDNAARKASVNKSMSAQAAKAETFRSLHVSERPLVLFNIWDAGSAKAVASAGARALATGSWSAAAANGFADGEQVPLDLVIDNLARIVRAADLPVTIDLESGYGEDRRRGRPECCTCNRGRCRRLQPRGQFPPEWVVAGYR